MTPGTDTPAVAELLATYTGARVFFEPLAGNNGDRLIEMGSRLALASAGLELAPDAATADVVVMNGGFGISELYVDGVRSLARYGAQMPSTPLVVLPSSISFADPQPLRAALAGRTAPTTVYAREPYTFHSLTTAGLDASVRLGLDHDMAFRLQGSPWLECVRRAASEQHCLVVERTDVEGITGASMGRIPEPVSAIISVLPPALRRFLRRVRVSRHRRRAARTPFAQSVRRRILTGPFAGLPVRAADVSLPEVCPFDAYVAEVASAAVVATNRLHVAILSAILGKRTFLWPVSTFKNASVYEYSLRAYPNVAFVNE